MGRAIRVQNQLNAELVAKGRGIIAEREQTAAQNAAVLHEAERRRNAGQMSKEDLRKRASRLMAADED